MIEHKLLIGFIVGLSLLPVASSINLELLSVLEYSLTGSESTNCDLVVFGKELAIDVDHELQRPMIFSPLGSTDVEYVIRKSLVALSKCLILLMSDDEVSINKMKYLADKFMNIKPTGVVYEVKNEYRIFAKDAENWNWPFPVILKKDNGKSQNPSIYSRGVIFTCGSRSTRGYFLNLSKLNLSKFKPVNLVNSLDQ